MCSDVMSSYGLSLLGVGSDEVHNPSGDRILRCRLERASGKDEELIRRPEVPGLVDVPF